MAKDKTPDGKMIYQRTPAQAYRVFGFDGDRYDGGNDALGAPRQKYLFLVRFVRGAAEGKTAEWENGLSFACKRFDRPRVNFETQVLNQYNKKRIIQTGVKYNPVRIEYHDTADQSVMQMWHEYSSYYFGDFRKANATDWTYDIVNPDYQDAGKEGFGLTLPNESTAKNPSSFFTALECYQFSGGFYTQFDLVNPKIISFDPDEMDYGSDVGHGLTMTLDYEAIIYKNNNKPLNMKDANASAFIKSLMTNRYFNGDVHEPDGPTPPIAQSSFNNGIASKLPGSILSATPWETVSVTPVKSAASSGLSSIGSALGAFGSFNFGSASAIASNVLKQPGLVQAAVGGNLKGAADQLLNGYKQNALNTVLDTALNPAKATSGVNAALFDVARGSAQSIMNGGNGNSTQQWAKARVASSVIGSLVTSPKKDPGGDDWI